MAHSRLCSCAGAQGIHRPFRRHFCDLEGLFLAVLSDAYLGKVPWPGHCDGLRSCLLHGGLCGSAACCLGSSGSGFNMAADS